MATPSARAAQRFLQHDDDVGVDANGDRIQISVSIEVGERELPHCGAYWKGPVLLEPAVPSTDAPE